MKNIKLAFRNLLNNKTVSTINLFGLTLGVVISVLLFSHVRQEKSTDKFIKDYDDIYLLTSHEGKSYFARPMIDLIRDRFPEIEVTHCTTDWAGQIFLSDNAGNSFKVNHMLNSDSTFFNVFQFELISGNAQNALDLANKIVLKESLAKKIFGNQDPIGKTLHLSTSYYNKEPMIVSAVVKDFPPNSAWQFDAIISNRLNDKKISWYANNANRWESMNYSAFCRLPRNIDSENFRIQFNQLSKSTELKRITDIMPLDFSIKPYSQCYLHVPSTDVDEAILKSGNLQMLRILELIAVLILLMACINYVNLVSAQRKKRNKSVAIIKMLGSERWGIMQIFMAEAVLLILAVVLISSLIIPFVLHFFNNLMETHYTPMLFTSLENIPIILGILAVTFLVTGLFPGIIFSNYQALRLIKPLGRKEKGLFLRNALPILQFSVAIALITCLIGIKKQNDMMLRQNTGFQREHVMCVAVNSNLQKQSQTLVNNFKSITGVTDITFADADFVNGTQNWTVNFNYEGEEKHISFRKIGVSQNFFDFFGIKLIEGESFTKKEANNKEVVFNEKALKTFAITDKDKATVLGKGKIVGVVEDFNLKSAHHAIDPVGFLCDGEASDYMYLKINPQNYIQLKNTITQLENEWSRLSPNIPFEYQFLDDEWNHLYKKEVQFQNLLTQAGWISIFIACLGLLGLSIFVAEQRTKEIGIRKVNGATILEILTMLNTNFIKWVLIAFIIATPIAYYAISRWLENFAYKTTLSWWIFALAGLSALVIALITVSWQSWRAARRNPVEALRYE